MVSGLRSPTFACQMSGEYAMIIVDGGKAMMESLPAFKRAGADAVALCFVLRAAKLLTNA